MLEYTRKHLYTKIITRPGCVTITNRHVIQRELDELFTKCLWNGSKLLSEPESIHSAHTISSDAIIPSKAVYLSYLSLSGIRAALFFSEIPFIVVCPDSHHEPLGYNEVSQTDFLPRRRDRYRRRKNGSLWNTRS